MDRTSSALLIISISLNVVMIGACATFIMHKGGIVYIQQKLGLKNHEFRPTPTQADEAQGYRLLPHGPREMVFLGDSLTASAPIADYFTSIKNGGIYGDTSAGVLARIDDVVRARPARIYLMIGTNDVGNEVPTAEIVENYRAIIHQVRRQSSGTQLFVESVLPVSERRVEAPLRNRATRELNRELARLAGNERVPYIDLVPAISNRAGGLRDELTNDGLHLNREGQIALLDALKPYVTNSVD